MKRYYRILKKEQVGLINAMLIEHAGDEIQDRVKDVYSKKMGNVTMT